MTGIGNLFRRLTVSKAQPAPTPEPTISHSLSFFGNRTIKCKIVLLDDQDINVLIKQNSLGEELINQVLVSLDISSREFFGLQFQDIYGNTNWLDVKKTIKHQSKKMINFSFYFRVKFFPLDPEDLGEELIRYQLFLQLRRNLNDQSIKCSPTLTEQLAALVLQAELGDYDSSFDVETLSEAIGFIRSFDCKTKIKVIENYKKLGSLTPSQCEIMFLRYIKNIDSYGVALYNVLDEMNVQLKLGLSPRGVVIQTKSHVTEKSFPWQSISEISFRKTQIKILVKVSTKISKYNFSCANQHQAKILWKAAVEHHSFYRLIRIINNRNTSFFNFLSLRSGFRYSGRTMYESSKDLRSTKSTNPLRRTRSEILSLGGESMCGYIRIGTRVLVKAQNGEYFRATVIGLSEKVYCRLGDCSVICHSRTNIDAILCDSDPHSSDIFIGSKVVAIWPGISSYLPGTVQAIENRGNETKYLVRYEDGDSRWNSIKQMRLVKTPLYFGPGSNSRYLQKTYSLLKSTSIANYLPNISEMEKNEEKSTFTKFVNHNNTTIPSSSPNIDISTERSTFFKGQERIFSPINPDSRSERVTRFLQSNVKLNNSETNDFTDNSINPENSHASFNGKSLSSSELCKRIDLRKSNSNNEVCPEELSIQ